MKYFIIYPRKALISEYLFNLYMFLVSIYTKLP